MNRRGTEPYARWCERTGEATPLPTRSCHLSYPHAVYATLVLFLPMQGDKAAHKYKIKQLLMSGVFVFMRNF